MIISPFFQRKSAILSKLDKSSIGEWDKKITSLCNKINSKENFYTTSSCSGRIVLMLDKDKKSPDLFLKVWHKLISFSELKISLKSLSKEKEIIKFKLEPPILHIASKNLEEASCILEKAKSIGWKRSGINTLGKNIILELNSTERLEFPISKNGKPLIDDNFLKLIVKQANQKLKKGWEKIEKLKNSI
jgi:tRNA wybutosine-synthesizing protein 3